MHRLDLLLLVALAAHTLSAETIRTTLPDISNPLVINNTVVVNTNLLDSNLDVGQNQVQFFDLTGKRIASVKIKYDAYNNSAPLAPLALPSGDVLVNVGDGQRTYLYFFHSDGTQFAVTSLPGNTSGLVPYILPNQSVVYLQVAGSSNTLYFVSLDGKILKTVSLSAGYWFPQLLLNDGSFYYYTGTSDDGPYDLVGFDPTGEQINRFTLVDGFFEVAATPDKHFMAVGNTAAAFYDSSGKTIGTLTTDGSPFATTADNRFLLGDCSDLYFLDTSGKISNQTPVDNCIKDIHVFPSGNIGMDIAAGEYRSRFEVVDTNGNVVSNHSQAGKNAQYFESNSPDSYFWQIIMGKDANRFSVNLFDDTGDLLYSEVGDLGWLVGDKPFIYAEKGFVSWATGDDPGKIEIVNINSSHRRY